MDTKNCELLSQCIFLQGEIVKIPKFDKDVQGEYCIENYKNCERYQFSKSTEHPKYIGGLLD